MLNCQRDSKCVVFTLSVWCTERDIVLQMLTAAHSNSDDTRLQKVSRSEQVYTLQQKLSFFLLYHLSFLFIPISISLPSLFLPLSTGCWWCSAARLGIASAAVAAVSYFLWEKDSTQCSGDISSCIRKECSLPSTAVDLISGHLAPARSTLQVTNFTKRHWSDKTTVSQQI